MQVNENKAEILFTTSVTDLQNAEKLQNLEVAAGLKTVRNVILFRRHRWAMSP
jgi:hypothetical protein